MQFYQHTVGDSNLSNSSNISIRWQRVTYAELDLYPFIPLNKKKNPTRRPTPEELKNTFDIVNKELFLLREGKVAIRDPLDKSSLIAIIEFTPWNKLLKKDKIDLNFLSVFLRDSKQFISPVSSPSRSWGGYMWAIGWRKSSCWRQIIGRYIKKLTRLKSIAYDTHFQQSARIGKIIGHYFKQLGSNAFFQNQKLVKQFDLPSFDSLSYGVKPKDSDCSPHLTFTSQSFFNPPHTDDQDISQYAFVLFLPTSLRTGRLASPNSSYDITSGPFIFPDHKVGINFEHQHGIVKMIWQANKYKHCTLPSSHSSEFTRLGMSVQINLSIANACENFKKGTYKDPLNYFGDHFFHMFRTIKRITLLTTIMLYSFICYFFYTL
ncbi:hypothetical protein H4Q26_015313 [Puccinia striiformis f. sp. tritici PST-130]|nr:hypothetical protein H4Q26_015313 [Puccinia striiformis f. sp. tritici PST-130]